MLILSGVLEFKIPENNEIEILVIDGKLNYNIIWIVSNLIKNDKRIRLLKNPKRIQAVALNKDNIVWTLPNLLFQ